MRCRSERRGRIRRYDGEGDRDSSHVGVLVDVDHPQRYADPARRRRLPAVHDLENLRSSQVTGKPADSMAARMAERSRLMRPKYQGSHHDAVTK
jgi:hypothetical protein